MGEAIVGGLLAGAFLLVGLVAQFVLARFADKDRASVEGARQRLQLRVELRRERVADARALLAELQTTLRLLGEYVATIQDDPSVDVAELLSRFGVDEPPHERLKVLMGEIAFKLPLGPVADSWNAFTPMVRDVVTDVFQELATLTVVDLKSVVDLNRKLKGVLDAVDAYIVGDHEEND